MERAEKVVKNYERCHTWFGISGDTDIKSAQHRFLPNFGKINHCIRYFKGRKYCGRNFCE